MRLSNVLLLVYVTSTSAGGVLSSGPFIQCASGQNSIHISTFSISFDQDSNIATFDVEGNSDKQQNVTGSVVVTAYGKQVYTNSFDPCAADHRVAQLCPVPQGSFRAAGSVNVPANFASQIPEVTFSIPNLDGVAALSLTNINGDVVACIQSQIENGKSVAVPGVSYATFGFAAGAAIIGSVSAITGASAAVGTAGGAGAVVVTSPSVGDLVFWFQAVAFNGALSLNYPAVYRTYTQNFAWATGLVSWGTMQREIDNFRAKTGGNTAASSLDILLNTTLIYSMNTTSLTKRGLLDERDIKYSTGGSTNPSSSASSDKKGYSKIVHGLTAYAEELKVPSENTFMTVLLVFLAVIASIIVFLLLGKVILEVWAMTGHIPKKVESLRKNYWSFLSGTILRVLLVVYSTWVLFCLYQFRNGDSWAANLLAGASLAAFTGVLLFFTIRIFRVAQRARQQGGVEELYKHKPFMRKYGIFYDSYRSRFWWFFVPVILYSGVKSCFIALGDGHGIVQVGGQLACEFSMLLLLFWDRPFEGRGANIVNISISFVRITSLACLFVFVNELGFSETTTTITGVTLIAIQSTLTVILGILILMNAMMPLFRGRRKSIQEKEPTLLDKSTELDLAEKRRNSEGYVLTPTTDTFIPHSESRHALTHSLSDTTMEEYSNSYNQDHRFGR
ncbi:Flavin carrier protein 2 [Neolecta irregularis DAH-3]|uniref:Flavin carrier protein 2 n=1 Tax=Neolecta irregularis (strain DAH-3) TaxID=1198029 RepID=A0A1U7LSH2_NEOID|nr:Flavin carrier protein 2 [Neolecta irregularis DAH-3]|eukprot:OLL25492.1 Flavin carrier protein 2 [Neolecta irregularis DAH-3]